MTAPALKLTLELALPVRDLTAVDCDGCPATIAPHEPCAVDKDGRLLCATCAEACGVEIPAADRNEPPCCECPKCNAANMDDCRCSIVQVPDEDASVGYYSTALWCRTHDCRAE